jgi:hypothetical protein
MHSRFACSGRGRHRVNPMADTQHTPNKNREQKLKKHYGMSEQDYNALLEKQEGRCAICNNYRKLVVDHCHQYGTVRALLCSNCNSAIGLLAENPFTIKAAAAYVEAHLGIT